MGTATNARLLAGVCGLLLTAAPAAHANHDYYHHGECSYSAVSDGTDSPGTRWDGTIYLAVVAADKWTWAPSGKQITVECVLYVGTQPGQVVLSDSGAGAVAKAAPLTYHLDPDEVVALCTVATTADDVVSDCGELVGRPLLPPAAFDAIDRAAALADPAVDAAVALADGATCLALDAMDGGPADQPPTFDIRPDGDLYVAGEWFYDCPPYEASAS